jgi:hypothetical protein
MGSTMKLYSVKTTAKEYDGCRDVVFCWFCHAARPAPVCGAHQEL